MKLPIGKLVALLETKLDFQSWENIDVLIN